MIRNIQITSGVLMLLLLSVHWCAADIKVGENAADFTLPDINGEQKSFSEFKGKFVVLEWLNPDCPFIRKHYESGNMQALQKKYSNEGVIWISIDSSAQGKQGYYNPGEMKEIIKSWGAMPTAVLLDADGKVGHMYGAKTTPHMFVINPDGKLIYQGAIDDIPGVDPNDIPQAVNYVDQALHAALKGQEVPVSSTKSYGCSVKYAD